MYPKTLEVLYLLEDQFIPLCQTMKSERYGHCFQICDGRPANAENASALRRKAQKEELVESIYGRIRDATKPWS